MSIISFKFGVMLHSYNNKADENMLFQLYEMQAKWEIGIVDFYDELEPLDNDTLNSFMSDSIYPNLLGYDWRVDIFEDYLMAHYEEKYSGYTLNYKM